MKKTILSTLALGLIAVAGTASAAPITQDIHVVATVPSADFYVRPQLGWPQNPVSLNYNPDTRSWDSYDLALNVKNVTADTEVQASLAYSAVLAQINGSGPNIPLAVSIAGNSLSTTPVGFHAAGPNEITHILRITSAAATPAAGDYMGTVSLVFDVAAAP
jgi:hypothetical protein